MNKWDILVVGNGGREHAFAWKLAQSNKINTIYVAPGNIGTQKEKNVKNVNININDIQKLILFVKEKNIKFSIIGPELPLSIGIVNEFEKHGLHCLGPNKECAMIESSKSFSKKLMTKYNIPTANYKIFSNNIEAKEYVSKQQYPIVIKFSGLAYGKGVIIAKNAQEAYENIDNILLHKQFIIGNNNSMPNEIIIEEFLIGEEASFIVLTDGTNVIPMITSKDHKKLLNNDKGPNTGGMGSYSPHKHIDNKMSRKIIDTMIYPILNGMKKEGKIYKGFLFLGLIIMSNYKIKALEYNCRFGDPEAQSVMMLLKSDLVDLCWAAINNKLYNYPIKWLSKTSLGVVMISKGYPNKYCIGETIHMNFDPKILLKNNNIKIFYSAAKLVNNTLVTNGGRVLCIVSIAETLDIAYKNTFDIVKKIIWKNNFYRTDIGHDVS